MLEQPISPTPPAQHEPGLEQRLFMFKATYMILSLVVLLEGLLALRMGLKLVGANPDNAFTALIYGFTNIFLYPFAGLIGTPTVGGMALEISSLLAMVVYALLGWAFEWLVWVLVYRPREAAVAVLYRTRSERHIS